MDNVSEETEQKGFLETVFEDGKLVSETDLAEIRHNLTIELEQLSE